MKRGINCFALLLSVLLLFTGCTQTNVTESSEEKKEPDMTEFSVSIDGGYELAFDKSVHEYEIRIPAGRPRVPKISAVGPETAVITVTQAVIPDEKTEGTAYVDLKNGTETSTYQIRMIKDASLGFHLQYGDVWQFEPEYALQEGEKYTFISSAPGSLFVGPAGTMVACGLSKDPVTVTAKVGGKEVGSIKVDQIVKAPLNIFLITGQSNAAGTYDIPEGTDEGYFTKTQLENTLKPKQGTVLCTDVTMTGLIQESMYDLSRGRAGFSPALGKTWYDLTGEKSLMIQTAVGGAPIEAWEKPSNGTRYTYTNAQANFYETTKYAYDEMVAQIRKEDSGYELNHVYVFWLQGETGMASSYIPDMDGPGIGNWAFGARSRVLNADQYFNIFMKNMEYFREDMNCEFMGILLVRAVVEVASQESKSLQLFTDLCPARAAQYALNNQNDRSIALVSRVCDIARVEAWEDTAVEGWGYMGCNNLHYNQTGHNANGVQAAENTYLNIYGRDERKADEIELIKDNGRDRFTDGETIELIELTSYQLAAMVLPMYTDTPEVTYVSEDPAVATVDAFGMITAGKKVAGQTVKITVRNEETGLEKSINVKVVKP